MATEDRIIALRSGQAFGPTLERIIAAIEDAGLTVFARIDHAAAAEAGRAWHAAHHGRDLRQRAWRHAGDAGFTGCGARPPAARARAGRTPAQVWWRSIRCAPCCKGGRSGGARGATRARAAAAGRCHRKRRVLMSGTVATELPASTILAADAPVYTGRQYLAYLPIGLFGSVMGLTGLSVAWRLAHAPATEPRCGRPTRLPPRRSLPSCF